MKYGVILYKDTENLGDDVQTYATLKFLPQIDYIIDRDNITNFYPQEKENVATILNAWWMNQKYNWPPSPYIYPLLVSMHFTHYDTIYHIDHSHIEGYGLEYFKKYDRVGCRDEYTKILLEERGINSYLSGCMTLTLDKFEKEEEEEYILLVDVNEKIESIVKKKTNKKIKKLTNFLDKSINSCLSFEKRMKNVEKYLKIIQNASLVITPRLHCALPSLALETPVLLIDYSANNDRTGSFLKILNFMSEEDFLNEKYNLESPLPNKKDYLKIRKELENTCFDFIENSKKVKDKADLPEVSDYREFTRRSEFQKKLLLDSYDKLNQQYNELIIKHQELWKSRNILQEEYDKLYNEHYNNIDK